jgi:hypothetical protein
MSKTRGDAGVKVVTTPARRPGPPASPIRPPRPPSMGQMVVDWLATVNVTYLVHVGCHLITTCRPRHRINGRRCDGWMNIGGRGRYRRIVEGGRKHVGRQCTGREHVGLEHVGRQLKGLQRTRREHVGRQIKGANLRGSTLLGTNMSGANLKGPT